MDRILCNRALKKTALKNEIYLGLGKAGPLQPTPAQMHCFIGFLAEQRTVAGQNIVSAGL